MVLVLGKTKTRLAAWSVAIRSAFPLKSKSRITIELTLLPGTVIMVGAANDKLPGVLLFLNMKTLDPLSSVTKISNLPSPLISAEATCKVLTFGASKDFVNEMAPGDPVFKNTEIFVELLLAVATSSFPSPSKSAVVKSYNAFSELKSD